MLLEFDLHLQEPKEMFVFNAETYDPFDDYALGESGLDYLLARVAGFWFRPPKVRTRVHLPADKIGSDTQDKMRRAMHSFCDDLLVENKRERVEFVYNNILFLVIALVVLVLIVWLQRILGEADWVGDSLLRNTLSYGLDILAWVALWTPFSAFLLDWFPLFRRYQAYKTLKNMDLTVHAESNRPAK
jgi:hypothetical protein